jgi:hypothetical protein
MISKKTTSVISTTVCVPYQDLRLMILRGLINDGVGNWSVYDVTNVEAILVAGQLASITVTLKGEGAYAQ